MWRLRLAGLRAHGDHEGPRAARGSGRVRLTFPAMAAGVSLLGEASCLGFSQTSQPKPTILPAGPPGPGPHAGSPRV